MILYLGDVAIIIYVSVRGGGDLGSLMVRILGSVSKM